MARDRMLVKRDRDRETDRDTDRDTDKDTERDRERELNIIEPKIDTELERLSLLNSRNTALTLVNVL